MAKQFIVVPMRQDIQDIFIQSNRTCTYFVDDEGFCFFDSKETAVNALVKWGLGTKTEVESYFDNGDLVLREVGNK